MSIINRKKFLTPCVSKCSTSTGDKICRGCGRTVEQIRDWHSYSDDKKRTIMAELVKKKE